MPITVQIFNLARFLSPGAAIDSDRQVTARIAETFERDLELAELPPLTFIVRQGEVTVYCDELTAIERAVVQNALVDVEGVRSVVDRTGWPKLPAAA